MVIVRFLGNPGFGEVLHFSKPSFRRGEFAQKAVGASDLKVRLDQAATADIMAGLGRRDHLRDGSGAFEFNLGQGETLSRHFQETEPHASLVQYVADGDVVGVAEQAALP